MDDAQMTNLRNLKEMLDEGILTQKEFDDKKKAVLAGSAALVPATKKGGAPPVSAVRGRRRPAQAFDPHTAIG